jgi:hypothetical protein
MASFRDRKGNEWLIELDAVVIEEIRDDHGINLVNLDKDPLLQLRNDPLTLVSCVSVICRDQQKERELTPKDFAKLLPSPPDVMLEAVKEAVIGFFPSGRALHVREVLAKFDQMAETSERLAESRMVSLMEDPRTAAAMNQKADEIFEKAMQSLKSLPVGTVDITTGT